jgi:hypothetical protein
MTPHLPDTSCIVDRKPVTGQVEAVLSIDNREQIVLPKKVRKKAHIRDSDKPAPVSWMKDDEICCLALVRTDTLSSEVSGVMCSLFADKD